MASAVLIEPERSAGGRRDSTLAKPISPFWTTTFPPVVVVVAAIVLAGFVYTQFWNQGRHLWWSTLHDRNAHYLVGQNMALDLREGNLVQLVHHFDVGSRVWGPLHPTLMAPVLAIGGIDFRLGVIPSLTAWIGAALFGFLAARRAAPSGGNIAGFMAALFILASPAHGAFATDTMLESLGACLTLAVIYSYLRTQQEDGVWPGRLLGLSLTLLFFDKYNYWLLMILGLIATEAVSRFRLYRDAAFSIFARIDWRASLLAQLRHPLNYCIAAMLGLLVWQKYGGLERLNILSWQISFQTPHNLVHIAYVFAFLRVLPWWLRTGRHWVQSQDRRVAQVVYWHLIPVALWFLWPRRLAYFLIFVGLGNQGEQPSEMFPGGWITYWNYFVQDYHIALWSALFVATGVAVLAVGPRRLRPGSLLIICFLIVATFLTVHHPNRKARFLHSWVATAWVAAGVGFARLLTLRPSSSAWRFGAACAVGGLVFAHTPGLLQARRSQEGGIHPERPSATELMDCYLPHLAGARHPIVLSNRPLRFMTCWSYQDRYGRSGKLETEIRSFGPVPEANADAFKRWLETTTCDAVVFLHLPEGSRFHELFPYFVYDRFPEWMTQQAVFHLVQTWTFPQLGGGTVTLWRRVNG